MTGSITPTIEQQQAIETAKVMQPGDLMTLNAYAGAGKSSTLNLIANAVEVNNWKTLYVAFNTDMVNEAKEKMPASVECRTSHSLAFRPMLMANPHWRNQVGNLNAREVALALKLRNNTHTQVACRVFNKFLASAHRQLTDPKEWFTQAQVAQHSDGYLPEMERENVRKLCLLIYEEFFGRKEAPRFKLPHDAYLWSWVNSKPILGLDLLLLDEGQDLNPVMIQFAIDQRGAGTRVIVVGDRHQSIYGWRGAKNSLTYFGERAQYRLSLTHSFRFPQPVADQASRLLNRHMGDNARLTGCGSGKPKKEKPTRCVIARTNAELLGEAMRHIGLGKKVNFAATKGPDFDPTTPYKIQELRDVFCLSCGRLAEIKTPLIRRFSTIGQLRTFAMQIPPSDDDQSPVRSDRSQPGDPELQSMLNLVDRFGETLLDQLDEIVAASTSPEKADMFFSTAHRAKGLQWDYVEVLPGFLPLDDQAALAEYQKKHGKAVFTESLNLLYVAITRSTVETVYPADSARFFQVKGAQVHTNGRRIVEHARTPARAGVAQELEPPPPPRKPTLLRRLGLG